MDSTWSSKAGSASTRSSVQKAQLDIFSLPYVHPAPKSCKSLWASHATLGGHPAAPPAPPRANHRDSVCSSPGTALAFPFCCLQVCNTYNRKKNPVRFPPLTHLKGFSRDGDLINAFSGRMGISPDGGMLSLGNAI